MAEWFWTDASGGQQGPGSQAQLEAAYNSGQTNASCLAWTAGMDNWTTISDIPALKSLTAPKPAPQPVAPGPRAPVGRAPVGVSSGPVAPTGPRAPSGPRAPMGGPSAPSAPAPAARSVWRELKTADGMTYYHNTQTNKTQWDKPDELLTEADRGSSSNRSLCAYPRLQKRLASGTGCLIQKRVSSLAERLASKA